MVGLMLAGSAVVPSILLLWFLYARDASPEPRGLVAGTFGLGALVCLPVVPVALGLESLGAAATGVWSKALVGAFLGAALPEELFKFGVLRWASRRPAFDEPMDGIVYGAAASLGFATLENILYVGGGGFGIAVLRALTAVPGHALTGVIMGAYFGRARFATGPERAALARAGLLWAVALHGLYDTFLLTQTTWALLALVVLAVEVHWGLRLVGQLRDAQALPTLVLGSARPLVAAAPALATALLAPPPNPHDRDADRALPPAVAPPPRLEPPRRRSAASVAKLAAGGLGLSAAALYFLGIIGAAFEEGPDAAPALGLVIVAALALLPTAGFALLFRSGLRGPFVESATRGS